MQSSLKLTRSQARWLLKAVSHDDRREMLCQIMYKDRLLVATDGYRMHVLPFDSVSNEDGLEVKEPEDGTYLYSAPTQTIYQTKLWREYQGPYENTFKTYHEHMQTFKDTWPFSMRSFSERPEQYHSLPNGYFYGFHFDTKAQEIVLLGINMLFRVDLDGMIVRILQHDKTVHLDACYVADALSGSVMHRGAIVSSTRPMLIGHPEHQHALIMPVRLRKDQRLD